MGRWCVSVVRLGGAALPFQAPGVSVRSCEHVMRFPTAKLLDFEPQLSELPHHANPFALVTAAHLSALRTRADVDRRLAAKRQLLRLPPPQEHQVWQDIEAIERSASMKYVTSVERIYKDKRLTQGRHSPACQWVCA